MAKAFILLLVTMGLTGCKSKVEELMGYLLEWLSNNQSEYYEGVKSRKL
jgi:hypothetical protein